ncbi:hypothetical protein ABZ819_09075 [Streptomyces venezuelae]|uniref:hypothetical protein n=1 Tax=Streptomyces venezuelae TaxID=54571 RepID=UPI0034210CF4
MAVSMAWATGAMIHQWAVGRSGSSLRLTDFTAGVPKYSVMPSLVISRLSPAGHARTHHRQRSDQDIAGIAQGQTLDREFAVLETVMPGAAAVVRPGHLAQSVDQTGADAAFDSNPTRKVSSCQFTASFPVSWCTGSCWNSEREKTPHRWKIPATNSGTDAAELKKQLAD